jgi:hypothetical protein
VDPREEKEMLNHGGRERPKDNKNGKVVQSSLLFGGVTARCHATTGFSARLQDLGRLR